MAQQQQTILHVINSLGRGGAEVLLCNTISLLPQYRHVLVTLSGPHDQLEVLNPLLHAHYCINALQYLQWPGGIIRLRRIILRYQPVLVHTHLQVAGLVAKVACPRKVPLFYTLHSLYSIDAFGANKLAILFEKATARSYHHLIGVSHTVVEDYRAIVPSPGSTDVLYNFAADSFFAQQYKLRYKHGGPLRCVSVGNLKTAKNYGYTLESFRHLKGLAVTLDIWGTGGEEAALRRFVTEHGLDVQIHFKGVSVNISSVLPQYDIYIISSSNEGFGIAPLEAMAGGMPVLASDIPVFREVLASGADYFDLADATSLSGLLTQIINDPARLAGMSARSTARALEIATPAAYINNLLTIYRRYTALI